MKNYWEGLILILSIYVIMILALEVINEFSGNVVQILETIDIVICIIFLIDWFNFYFKSDNRKTYFKVHLIDLIASMPFVLFLRAFRMFRIVRTVRLLRGLKGVMPLMRLAARNKMHSVLITYVLCMIIVFFYCSLGLYNFEKNSNGTINDYGDAMWTSFTTMTSVGYGDVYPVTSGGLLLAVILVTTGMGLFSLVTAEFATIFLRYINDMKSNEYNS
jgi:voltage-gated potassium channel